MWVVSQRLAAGDECASSVRRYLVIGWRSSSWPAVVRWSSRGSTGSPLEQALDAVPAASLRVAFTDWSRCAHGWVPGP